MSSSKLLIALVGSVGVASATTAAPPVALIYKDAADGSCVPGKTCTAAAILTGLPALRSLCVATAGGNKCWDACNTAHAPTDYYAASAVNDLSEGYAMFVKQLRTGMRTGSCPGSKYSPTCNPGDRCTPAGLTLYRGMCVTITGAGNQCLDMCDKKTVLAISQTAGKQAGTLDTVNAVRAGRDPKGRTTCPGPSVWIWLWIPIVLCCLMGFVFGAWKVYEMKLARSRKSNKGAYREPDQPFADENPASAIYQPQEMDQVDAPPMAAAGAYAPKAAPPMEPENDPMPVLQPEPVYSAPVEVVQPTESFPNLFGPGPVSLVAPQTVAPNFFPGMGTLQQPITTYSQPIMTSYPQAYPQAGSFQPQVLQAPRTTSAYTTPFVGSMTNPMTTVPPSYGAYGAYGASPSYGAQQMAANTTVYPGTTSMRIG